MRRHLQGDGPMTFSAAMMGRSAILIALALAGVCGCGDRRRKGAQAGPEETAYVPYLVDDKGVEFPYFRYENYIFFPYDSGHQDGLAMFLHPIFEDRVKGLVLNYLPTQDIKSLFGEELFGGEFFVGSKGGVLAIEGLPISLPSDMKPCANWAMNHAEQIFDCRFEAMRGEELLVDCVSSKGSLEFGFDRERGVTKFQDYCDGRVCTYYLKTDVGLLSPYHRSVIGL